MAKTYTISATITIEEAQGPPVIDEQPPTNSTFTFGVPKTIPYGKAHDPDGDPLTVTLEPPVAGYTVSINPTGQIMLAYDGKGAKGVYTTAVVIDDGRPSARRGP